MGLNSSQFGVVGPHPVAPAIEGRSHRLGLPVSSDIGSASGDEDWDDVGSGTDDLIDRLADIADTSRVKVRSVPSLALFAAGLFSPAIRELREINYQFEAPFIIDSTHTEQTFGLAATPIEATIAGYRATASTSGP